MNFQTMSKQRKFILIASAIGIVAMFLPWIDFIMINQNGLHGKGIVVFLCFITAAVISYLGDQTLTLDKTMWMVTLIAGALAVFLLILFYFDVRNPLANILSYGFYLAFLAGVGVLLAAYLFRTPGQDIKSGFDSLKKDIEDKTKSNTVS